MSIRMAVELVDWEDDDELELDQTVVLPPSTITIFPLLPIVKIPFLSDRGLSLFATQTTDFTEML